jgi:hypothetical protein
VSEVARSGVGVTAEAKQERAATGAGIGEERLLPTTEDAARDGGQLRALLSSPDQRVGRDEFARSSGAERPREALGRASLRETCASANAQPQSTWSPALRPTGDRAGESSGLRLGAGRAATALRRARRWRRLRIERLSLGPLHPGGARQHTRARGQRALLARTARCYIFPGREPIGQA